MRIIARLGPHTASPTKNADLFSSCIHLLTLVAFNVHALVGCCAHHNHASPLGGHDEIACHSSLESGHDHLAGHDEDANHDHPIGDLALVHEHHDGNPCDHSQPCDEGRCVFVDARLVSFQLDLPANASVAFGTSDPGHPAASRSSNRPLRRIQASILIRRAALRTVSILANLAATLSAP